MQDTKRHSREADRASSDTTWTSGKAALGGNRPGAHVLRNFYYSADPNTGRGRSAAGAAYRERERDSDSERR